MPLAFLRLFTFGRPVEPPFPWRGLALSLAWALGAWGTGAAAQVPSGAEGEPPLSSALQSTIEADELAGKPDVEASASGNVDFRQGTKRVQADKLTYQQATSMAHARGNVLLSIDGNWFSGPEMRMDMDRYVGFFSNPTYFIASTQAGGTAERWEFLSRERAVATRATYTSCQRDDPAWVLSADTVRVNHDRNEGIAEGAVLRFYGVPILAAPKISFPLTDERKSGWLPFTTNVDNKGGFQVAAPYYWNIAPNRDAKLTPVVSARRGVGLETDFRYLEPLFEGRLSLHSLPHDRLLDRERWGAKFQHQGTLPGNLRYDARVTRVSDNDYWKDFPRTLVSLTPRLLEADLGARHNIEGWTTYARVKRWQVLQDTDPLLLIDAPYDRLPQIGARTVQPLVGGFQFGFEGEYNQFVNPRGFDTRAPSAIASIPAAGGTRPTGARVHALSSLSWPVSTPGWTFVPKLSLNSAGYSLEQPLAGGNRAGQSRFSRTIPSFSLDSAWVFERDTDWFGRSVRQTLEPRVLYVNTAYRAQSGLPNFDAAEKDFNVDSIYTDNTFSGVDRVSDANQLTVGVTTRLINPKTGAEVVRLGIAQRALFEDQRVTANDGPPTTQSLSDLLLFGSSNLWRRWYLDSAVQYNPDTERTVRSIVGARYSPGPYRTINLSYRMKRGESEQADLAWQWPLYGATHGLAQRSASDCQGAWYSAGRVNYSLREKRVTDSVLAFEYDSGCWIGRLMVKRLSTSLSQATTQFGAEFEFVGLSRLGVNNPLRVLRDNIVGYRPLRNDDYDDQAGSLDRNP